MPRFYHCSKCNNPGHNATTCFFNKRNTPVRKPVYKYIAVYDKMRIMSAAIDAANLRLENERIKVELARLENQKRLDLLQAQSKKIRQRLEKLTHYAR